MRFRLALGLVSLVGFGCGDGAHVAPAPPPPITPPSTPPPGPATAVHAGLLALCAGDGAVRADWDLPEGDHEAALFQAESPAGLLAGPPALSLLSGDSGEVSGLPNGRLRFFTLAIRPRGSADWVQSGAVLRARPTPPIYVDAAASAQGADGRSAATALPSLGDALALAAAAGGGNVWVRDGAYSGPLSLSPKVHVFGGFGPDFSLAGRDPDGGRTVVHSRPETSAFVVRDGDADAVIDGVVLDGLGLAVHGVDHERRSLELRNVTVHGFRSAGVRLSSPRTPAGAVLAYCHLHSNGGDGLTMDGDFALRLDACRFDSNVANGAAIQSRPTAAGISTLEISDCRFFGNGLSGLAATLTPPPAGGAVPSITVTTVRGSRFIHNRNHGIGLTAESSTAEGGVVGAGGGVQEQEEGVSTDWRVRIVVRETETRRNGRTGLLLDGTGAGSHLLHRLRATANKLDGVALASSAPGHVVVSSCHFAGNLGAGIRGIDDDNQLVVFASQSVFAGNRLGGLFSSFLSSANSCIAHRQPQPWQSVHGLANAVVEDPAIPLFVRAPRSYGRALAANANALTLATDIGARPGDVVELDDEGVGRTVLAVSGTMLVLDTLPDDLLLPASVALFSPGSPVVEDLHLAAASPVLGTGMTPAGGPPVDPGVYGGPADGEPGVADPIPAPLLWTDRLDPPTLAGAGSAPVTVELNRVMDPASFTNGRLRIADLDGNEIPVRWSLIANRLTLDPPTAGGWGQLPLRVELHRGLRALDGTSLSAPVLMMLETAFRQ